MRRERKAGVVLMGCAMIWVALAAGCDDDPVVQADPVPQFDPYASAATVRVVHMAPSVGPITADLDRPSTEQIEPEGGGELVQGPPTLEPVSDGAISFTGYAPKSQYAPTPDARLNVSDADGAIAEMALTLEPQKHYLAVLVESAGQTAVELLTGYSPPADTAPDGQTRVSVFHGAESVGTFGMAIRRLDGGPDEAQWPGLSFGVSSLHEPKAVAPGDYELLLLDSSGATFPAVAPSSLHLEADTHVQILIASPSTAGGLPLLMFIVD